MGDNVRGTIQTHRRWKKRGGKWRRRQQRICPVLETVLEEPVEVKSEGTWISRSQSCPNFVDEGQGIAQQLSLKERIKNALNTSSQILERHRSSFLNNQEDLHQADDSTKTVSNHTTDFYDDEVDGGHISFSQSCPDLKTLLPQNQTSQDLVKTEEEADKETNLSKNVFFSMSRSQSCPDFQDDEVQTVTQQLSLQDRIANALNTSTQILERNRSPDSDTSGYIRTAPNHSSTFSDFYDDGGDVDVDVDNIF